MKLPATLSDAACAVIVASLDEVAQRLDRDERWRRLAAPADTHDVGAFRRARGAVQLGDGLVDAGAWVCAVDPVWQVADMRDVRIARWPAALGDEVEAAALLESLRALLDDDADPRLRRMQLVSRGPAHCFLVAAAEDGLSFTAPAPEQIVGKPLRGIRPQGADGPLVQRLMTEWQMLLHQAGAGANGVWLYGAGVRPAPLTLPLPALMTDDSFWANAWPLLASAAAIEPLPADGAAAAGRFIAPAPATVAASLDTLLASDAIDRLHLISDDGAVSYARRGWRRWLARLGRRR